MPAVRGLIETRRSLQSRTASCAVRRSRQPPFAACRWHDDGQWAVSHRSDRAQPGWRDLADSQTASRASAVIFQVGLGPRWPNSSRHDLSECWPSCWPDWGHGCCCQAMAATRPKANRCVWRPRHRRTGAIAHPGKRRGGGPAQSGGSPRRTVPSEAAPSTGSGFRRSPGEGAAWDRKPWSRCRSATATITRSRTSRFSARLPAGTAAI